jgi:hypothetical protein
MRIEGRYKHELMVSAYNSEEPRTNTRNMRASAFTSLLSLFEKTQRMTVSVETSKSKVNDAQRKCSKRGM